VFTAAHLRDTRRDRAILIGALIALTALCWLSMWAWEGSPYAGALHHGAGAGPTVAGAALFSAGWVLMVVAMMLPSSTPLVLTFAAIVGRRRRPGRLVGLLLLGYLAVWSSFGIAAWVLDQGVHAAVRASPSLAAHPQLIMGATLLGAGLWQFSSLRERCLDACRSPLGFVMAHWRGVAEQRESFRMGLAHGAFCVGCCWPLMLVMFGVGVGSLGAMFALGGLTALERNLPAGRRLTRPVGVALVLAAVYVVAA
jgi:predicted metal-binding membrane protein